MPSNSNRTASILISLAGALFNLTIAIHVLALWKSIKWEPESEWEGALDGWKVDSVKLVWGLLSGYFSAAATISLIGFSGIIQVRTLVNLIDHFIYSPSLTVRIYHPMSGSTATISSQILCSAYSPSPSALMLRIVYLSSLESANTSRSSHS
jgi:hypothetical protein